MGTLVLALFVGLGTVQAQTQAQTPPEKPAAAPAKEKSPEQLAIERVQKLIVSTIDGSLPDRTLQSWLREVFGPKTGTSWELGDCAAQMGGPVVDRSRGLPTCVDATVALDARRNLHLVFFADIPKAGARPTPPKFSYGVVMEGGASTRWLKSLGEASRVR